MPVPNTFANATATIPLSQLDANFATTITLGNTAIQLGNTVTTLNNMTLANVNISSGIVTITNATVTTANVTTANIATAEIANVTVSGTSTFAAGSNTAPSITTSGDTNTGIFFPAADTVAIGTGGTEALRVTSTQAIGIGTTTPTTDSISFVRGSGKNAILELAGNGNPPNNAGAGTCFSLLQGTDNNAYIYNRANAGIIFGTNNAERARITSGGDFLVGQTSGSYNIISKAVSTEAGAVILSVERQQTSVSALLCYGVSQANYNAANAANKMGRDSSTLRSLNAGGTVNASGADYAEYMVKAGDFTIAKGDVCGIDANGKLTNVFADALSFVVKSTDPSYVGGDTWGVELEGDALEAARQTVDRIAFAGQVPVNVLGATAGQYIVPVEDNGAIKGIAKSESDMTLAEYMRAVGKVIAVEDDGRAKIIVKVA
jgi:hypothetical protein